MDRYRNKNEGKKYYFLTIYVNRTFLLALLNGARGHKIALFCNFSQKQHKGYI